MRNHPRVIPSLPTAAGPATSARQGAVPTPVGRDLLFNFCARVLCILGLVVALSSGVQAQEPVPLARGNTPGEPHHHLKIENEYVRVYYVEVPPHENTQLHQHDHDYIYVSLGPSDVVNAIVNKPEIHLQLKDGETHFTRGGFAHIARNLADTPFRNITIELLKPQGEPKNVCAQVLLGVSLGECPKSLIWASTRREPLLETAETSLDLVKPDPSLNVLSLRLTALIVFLGETQVGSMSVDATIEKVSEGDAAWISPASGKLIWNSKSKDTRFLMLTFSGSESAAKSSKN
jgi:quercetin dioxygenase-like cupin family protein